MYASTSGMGILSQRRASIAVNALISYCQYHLEVSGMTLKCFTTTKRLGRSAQTATKQVLKRVSKGLSIMLFRRSLEPVWPFDHPLRLQSPDRCPYANDHPDSWVANGSSCSNPRSKAVFVRCLDMCLDTHLQACLALCLRKVR